MEQFLQTLPRPVLVFSVIVIGVFVVMLLSPPRTLCDTQREQVEETLPGLTKPLRQNKQTMPPKITGALDRCYQGRSAGACYDYFQILRGLAQFVLTASSECRADIYEISDIKNRLQEGVQNIVLLAWGDYPPGPDAADRFGPLQDAEIALFCYLKSAMIAGVGETAWHEFRKKTSEKLPGEKVDLPKDPSEVMRKPRPANKVLSELDIWNRSLFSVRCENYR